MTQVVIPARFNVRAERSDQCFPRSVVEALGLPEGRSGGLQLAETTLTQWYIWLNESS